MSRSRSRKYYEDYDDDGYFEQFKNRRQNKLKKVWDRNTINNEEEDADLHPAK